MTAISGRILENVYTTAQWAAITTPLPDRVWGHEVSAGGVPIGSKMGNGIALWGALDYWYGGAMGAPVDIALTTASPSVYTLSAPELAAVNALGRIPNFQAITDSGQGNWGDIYPIYTPYNTPGSYTQIQVVLHDGGGVAVEDTVVQFS